MVFRITARASNDWPIQAGDRVRATQKFDLKMRARDGVVEFVSSAGLVGVRLIDSINPSCPESELVVSSGHLWKILERKQQRGS